VADASKKRFGGDACFFILSKAVGELALRELFVVLVYDQGMVQVKRALGAAKRFHQGDLPCRGIADVFAADNMRDMLVDVVDADGKLVRPLVVAVADREIPALELRILVKVAEAYVVPVDSPVRNDEPQVVRWFGRFSDLTPVGACTELSRSKPVEPLSSLVSRLSSQKTFPLIDDFPGFTPWIFFLELFSAAKTGVNERFCLEFLEGGLVNGATGALDALGIVMEPEPGEVFADACNVGRAGPALVVVFDPQVDLEPPFEGGGPYVKGRKQVTFVEVPRWAWRKSNNVRHVTNIVR